MAVRYMHCENATPCTIGGNVLPLTSTIFVPDAAVEDYRAAWTSYSDIIVGNSFDNLVEATVEALPSTSDLRAEIVGDKDEDEGEELLRSVVKLKVSGTINGYDMMIIRNKMTNLRELDLEEVTIVANDYEYYQGCHSEDNVFGGSFLRDTKIRSVVLPTTATRIGSYAFSGYVNLQTIDNYSNITSIGESAFKGCSNLSAIVIPRSITQIPNMCFYGCTKLDEIKLSPKTTNINGFAFEDCPGLTEFRLPPYLQSIGNSAFSRCNNLKEIYAYMVDVPAINTNTFNDYKHQILYVPQFLYNKYYYDTNWSQFLEVRVCDLQPGDYESFYTNSDVVFEDGERIDQDTPDVEIGEHGGVVVEGETPQNFDEVEQNNDGEGHSGSIVGEVVGENSNIIVNKLKLKLQVKANEWIGFNFPYEVTIAECEYPGQHVWIEYDGEARANGGSGWKVVEETEGAKLEANKGYMFMSSAKGKLIVTFEHPSFGGDKPQPLQSYSSGNAANAGWNFIGNPYSSYYAIDENDFSAPITVWNSSTQSYEAYRPGDDDYHLQPYQAFFVQMPQHVYVVNFSEEGQETYLQSQQTQANQAKMRKAAGIRPDRLLINLNIGDEETESIDRTRLVLNEKASRNYELECDAAKFISDVANAQLYLLENGVQMAIDERPTKGDIRLGYMAKQPGKLRIEASRMDMPLMLVDTKTGQTFDLSLGSYEFQTEAGTFNKRFMLRLSEEATAIKKLTEKTGVAIGLQDGGLSIGGAEGKSVSIYNANGVQVAQQSGNGFVSLPSGLYLVQVDDWSAKIYVK